MIAKINVKQIQKWEYLSDRQSGKYLGFYWLHHIKTNRPSQYLIFKLWNEHGYQLLELSADCDKTIRQIIEEGIDEHYHSLLLLSILSKNKRKIR